MIAQAISGALQMFSLAGDILAPRNPNDLRGFKIRLPVAPTSIALFRHRGASPTALNFNEVYSALQTGVVDGQENPLILIDVTKLYEVQKYVSLTNHIWTGLHCTFNVAAWKRLPPPIQHEAGHILTEAATMQRQDWLERNKTVSQHLQQNGMVFNAPDTAPFRAVLAKSGFYSGIEQRMSPEAWWLLQIYVGELG